MVYVTVCDKVKDVALHKDSSNEETHTQLPTVFPRGMVKLCPAELLHKVCDQINILYHLFPLPTNIEVLGYQLKELLTEYHVEPTTRTLIKSCNGTTSFAKA